MSADDRGEIRAGKTKVTTPLLLDTCAAIWILENAPLSDAAVEAMDQASDRGEAIYISPITAWEIAMLMAYGCVKSALGPQRWLRRLLAVPGVRLADMAPDILMSSSFLPGNLGRDPVDRILAATAREYDYTLVTRDPSLLDYAAEGHLRALAC
jgi:PIN domain nuclease of toxin-antitoxin system